MADLSSTADENKSYYERNREKCLEQAKEYQRQHKQIYAAYHQLYYKANKEKIQKRHQEWVLRTGWTRPPRAPKPPRVPKAPKPVVKPKTPTLDLLNGIQNQEYVGSSSILIQTPPEGKEFLVSFS